MQIHQVKRVHPNKKGKIIGRGGKRGTTSGKGTKGQLARSGRKLRPEFRDLIKKLPKLRGYRFNSIQNNFAPVNLKSIENKFNNGDTVSAVTLLSTGLIETYKGKFPKVKILATGEITKKLNFIGCVMSASAKEKIEKAGGTVKTN